MNARLQPCKCGPMPGVCPGPDRCPLCAPESDVPTPTDEMCVQAIVDDLLLGCSYPNKGGTLTAGEILAAVLSKAEIESALTAQVFGCGEVAYEAQKRLEDALKLHAFSYIERLHYNLIVKMRETIMDDLQEAAELDREKQREEAQEYLAELRRERDFV